MDSDTINIVTAIILPHAAVAFLVSLVFTVVKLPVTQVLIIAMFFSAG